MKKVKSEVTKERIIDEAVAIFFKEGYAASRTNEIAKAAEVSEATVFKYFNSKQGLLDSIVSIFIKQVSKKVIIDPLNQIFEENKHDSPDVLFKKIFMNRIELLQKYKKFGVVTLTESRFNTGIRQEIIEHLFPEVRALGEKIIKHYQSEGVFREDLDAWVTIRTAMMSVVGMMFTTELIGIAPRGGSVEAELEMIIKLILQGAVSDEWRTQNLRGDSNE